MRQIEYFGRLWTVRFDTDREPSKTTGRMGVNCTLTALDNGEVVTARSECSNKDTFRRETGEAESLKHALNVINKAAIRHAFITLKQSDKGSRISVGSSKKTKVATPAPTPAPVAVSAPVATVASVTKPKSSARSARPRTAKLKAK